MATTGTSPTNGETASTSTGVATTGTASSEAPAVELTADERALAQALADQRPNMDELVGVRYTGHANLRSFTVKDFEGVDIKAKGDLEFKGNGSVVPISKVNADTLDYLLADGEYEVVPKGD